MGVVFFVNTIVVLLAFCAKDRRFKHCFSLAFFLLTIFYAIRYDFGNDYWNYYYDNWLPARFLDFESAKEPLWHLLLHVFQPIGYFGFIILLTAVNNLIVYKLIQNNVQRQWWWLATFVFLFTFNFFLLGLSMIRQYTAMVLCLSAVINLANGKLYKYLVILAVTFLIHYSSLIMLLCLPFSFFRPNLRKPVFIISFVILFIVMSIASSKLASTLDIIMQMQILENYSNYSEWGEGNSSVLGIIFDSLMLGLVLYTYPKDKAWRALFLTLLISFVILPFSIILVLIVRIAIYFSFFSILCYPMVFSRLRKKIYFAPILLLYMVYTLRRTMVSYTGETYGDFYINYHTIFESSNWL